jgi:hypothetical protein
MVLPEHELSFDDVEIPKSLKRIHESVMGNKAKADRVAGIFQYHTGSEFKQGMDAIVAFLSGSSNENVAITKNGIESFAEQIDALHEFDGIPDDIVTEMLNPQPGPIIVDGYIQKKKDKDLTELIRTLETNGFDFLGSSATKGMKATAVRALKREFGENVDLSTMSKKEKKKYKKKNGSRRIEDGRNRISL